MFVNHIPQIGIGRMGDMKDVELCAMLLRKIEGVKESDVGVLRKIRAKKNIFIFYHNQPLSEVMMCHADGFFSGSLTLKTVPFPFSDETSITPPCSSTIFLAIINPRPVPLEPFVLKKI